MTKGTTYTRANLHGQPLKLARELAELTKHRGKGFPSIRAWGRYVSELICDLARTNVKPENFAGWVNDWVVEAIARQREIFHLQTCGRQLSA